MVNLCKECEIEINPFVCEGKPNRYWFEIKLRNFICIDLKLKGEKANFSPGEILFWLNACDKSFRHFRQFRKLFVFFGNKKTELFGVKLIQNDYFANLALYKPL